MSSPTLRDLRDQVAAFGAKHLNMFTILEEGDDEHIPGPTEIKTITFENCGTVACLAGHAAVLMAQSNVLTYENADIDEYWFYEQAIEYFDLPMALAENEWADVPLGDSTLWKRYQQYQDEGSPQRVASWRTVLDWLDIEIKKREEISS